MPSDASSAITRLSTVWFERRVREASAFRSAVSSGVSGRPSSATTVGCLGVIRPVRPGGSSSLGRVQAGLRADQPLLAPLGQRLAALPEHERLLEGHGALLQLVDDPDELVARLLVAERASTSVALLSTGQS